MFGRWWLWRFWMKFFFFSKTDILTQNHPKMSTWKIFHAIMRSMSQCLKTTSCWFFSSFLPFAWTRRSHRCCWCRWWRWLELALGLAYGLPDRPWIDLSNILFLSVLTLTSNLKEGPGSYPVTAAERQRRRRPNASMVLFKLTDICISYLAAKCICEKFQLYFYLHTSYIYLEHMVLFLTPLSGFLL